FTLTSSKAFIPIAPLLSEAITSVSSLFIGISKTSCLNLYIFRSLIQLIFKKRCESWYRSEEHTSELQSRFDLVCRLLLEKKKIQINDALINRCIGVHARTVDIRVHVRIRNVL